MEFKLCDIMILIQTRRYDVNKKSLNKTNQKRNMETKKAEKQYATNKGCGGVVSTPYSLIGSPVRVPLVMETH